MLFGYLQNNKKGAQRRHCFFKTGDDDSEFIEAGEGVPHNTHVNTNLHYKFSNAELNNNSHQIYNSNGLYAHKSHISNYFKSTLTNYRESCIMKVLTMKKIQRISSKFLFSLEGWNCTIDLTVSSCTVCSTSTFLQLRSYYIQIWKYESD